MMTSLPPSGPRPSPALKPARCHSCGARLPPDASWCSLCHADVRARTPDRPAPSVAAEAQVSEAEAEAEPELDATLADRLIAELAAHESKAATQSWLGRVQARLDGSGAPNGVVIGVIGGGLLLVVGLLGLTVLGLLL
jgi:hypothetical protein